MSNTYYDYIDIWDLDASFMVKVVLLMLSNVLLKEKLFMQGGLKLGAFSKVF